MKSSLNVLTGFTIRTHDGIIGKVTDFLIGTGPWKIDFVKVQTGDPFGGKKILIPPVFIGTPDWVNHTLPVDLRERDIARYSAGEGQGVITKEYIEEINRYYGLDDKYPKEPEPLKRQVQPKTESRSSDPSPAGDAGQGLQPYTTLKGYRVRYEDQKTGHFKDLIATLDDWHAGYLVVGMEDPDRVNAGVILPIGSVSGIDAVSAEITIGFSSDILKNLPVYPLEDETGTVSYYLKM